MATKVTKWTWKLQVTKWTYQLQVFATMHMEITSVVSLPLASIFDK